MSGDISKGYKNQLKGTLTSQNWNNMTIRKNNKNKRTVVNRIHGSLMIHTYKKLKLQRKFFFTEYQLINIKNDRKLPFCNHHFNGFRQG